jgi:pimeloyl-ACP methyl ester carboxylesterase
MRILFHGGSELATNWTGTPDGREGWAQFFLRQGYAVYVVDQPGQGRARFLSDSTLTQAEADYPVNHFIASERYKPLYPQARLHTQWPGSGSLDDPAVQQFIAGDLPALSSFHQKEELNRDALLALLEKIGPSILMAHSQAGAFGWPVADARPDLVVALLELEPNGPPAYNLEEIGPPGYFKYGDLVRPYGLTSVPLTYSPPVRTASDLSFVLETKADAPDLAKCYLQRAPARQLPNLRKVPILIMTSEASYHAPYDHCTVKFLRQASAEPTFIRLPDIGIHGNGHVMMLEKNNQEVAAVIAQWLNKTLGPRNQIAAHNTR